MCSDRTLDGAKLNSAMAEGADFHGASMCRASLVSAVLTDADISSARFFDANLNTSSLAETLFTSSPFYNDPDDDLTVAPGTIFPAGFDPVAEGWALSTEQLIPCLEPSAWLLQAGALAVTACLARVRRKT